MNLIISYKISSLIMSDIISSLTISKINSNVITNTPILKRCQNSRLPFLFRYPPCHEFIISHIIVFCQLPPPLCGGGGGSRKKKLKKSKKFKKKRNNFVLRASNTM